MNRLSRPEGFTLLEVLIAITILTVGLLGIGALTVGIIKANRQSTDITSATTLAQSTLEDITRRYELFNAGNGTEPATTTEDFGSIPYFPMCKRVTTVALDSPTTGMSRITVEVFWNNGDRSIVLETLMKREPPPSP